ncbi:MAG: acetyl-CoA carboxylase biotin carboxylase subunit [Myxococcota bacterium]
MKLIQKVLVANRGEIACRVMRTCRELGMATVAVYSEADRHAPHVKQADEAVLIGPAPTSESYLQQGRIIEAALLVGADAIHPGYGFLSENAGFAARVAEAGLIFVGPSVSSIQQMGSKRAARQLMAAHGVPVVPGYDGADQSYETLTREAQRIGFPLLIKASAGGGGKGMRIVREPTRLHESIEAAQREALHAFGDDSILLERYIDCPRHVEFQILGDQQGKLLHFFERECSIQRRHQKILEESPSPVLTPELRHLMAEAAVTAGKAIGYYNAGTVEFIVAPDGQFYFLEVNTRLQVEHPVTELVTGVDLVKLQLEVAQGLPLSFEQEDIQQRGHAVEARLYAEDPQNGFLPAIGKLHDWSMPSLPGLRIDTGVETGSEVSIYYDPMLAKVIAWGPDRLTSHRRLARALRQLSIQGVITNRAFLIRLIEHPAYLAGALHTHFIDEHFASAEERDELAHPERDVQALAAVTVALQLERASQQTILPQLPPGYRNNRFRDPILPLQVGEQTFEVSWRLTSAGLYRVMCGFAFMEVRLIGQEQQENVTLLRLEINGVQRLFRLVKVQEQVYVQSPLGSTRVEVLPRFPEKQVERDPGEALAPMPGKILKLRVKVGQAVSAGQSLVTLEAMKMEHTLVSPVDGVVESIFVEEGVLVDAGARLVHVQAVKA